LITFPRVVALSTVLHGYIAWRLTPALGNLPAVACAFAALMLVSAVLVPLGVRAPHIRAQPLSDRLAWAGLPALGLFSSLFVMTLLRDLGLFLAWLGASLFAPAVSMGPLVRWTGWTVLVAGLAVTVWGFINARRTARIVKVDIPIRGLPANLHGFSIAQISDIHVGPTIKQGYLDAIVRAVNGLDADLVAVTGDLVDGSVPRLANHVAPLAGLSSRHGTYFVTGNHEYYSGAHEEWIAELRRLGLRVLMNEHVVLRRGEAEVVLAGVADYTAHHFAPAHRSDPHAALAGAPAGAAVRVLLAHQPRSAAAAAEAGFDLQISGHTHGGQFWPWIYFVRLQQPFTAGLHRVQDLWVYTSRGTGYWGPPKRFGAPSEITALRLVST
jgi:predicted MPP superfamily phosphohydrolase